MWIFQHIPKTAGSSLAAELNRHAVPYTNLFAAPDAGVDVNASLKAAIDRFIAASRTWRRPPRSVSGHLTRQHVDYLRSHFPEARTFTFLRHPVARAHSEYVYSCSPEHPPHAQFLEAYPTFDSFISDPRHQNKCARYMFGTVDLSAADALGRMASTFAFVGLQERYVESFLLLSAALWEPMRPSVRKRVGPDKSPVDPQTRDFIIETNAIDYAMYEAVDRVYNMISPALYTLSVQE